jgi:surfactin synthase thioesterase subunit
MGALISFELARSLREHGRSLPSHLFVSAYGSPELPRRKPPFFHLPDDEFRKEVLDLEGIPKELEEHPELWEVILPFLRADIELVDTYRFQEARPLDIPITAFGGKVDKYVPRVDLTPWEGHTTSQFRFREFEGGHFYLNDVLPEIASDIVRNLQSYGVGAEHTGSRN